MISMDKKYRTRHGEDVRIYATDGAYTQFKVHGAINFSIGWVQSHWTADGRYSTLGNTFDLIEVKPRHKRTVWLNIYPDAKLQTRKAADHTAGRNRIACVKVEFDFEEGEGL